MILQDIAMVTMENNNLSNPYPIRLNDELREGIKKQAKSEERSFVDMTRILIRVGLKHRLSEPCKYE